jgi:hypothetical protein
MPSKLYKIGELVSVAEIVTGLKMRRGAVVRKAKYRDMNRKNPHPYNPPEIVYTS